MQGALSCVRPGCAAAAGAILTYDYADRLIWLDDPVGAVEPGQWGMCRDHADRLQAPRGWARQDRRRAQAQGTPLPV